MTAPDARLLVVADPRSPRWRHFSRVASQVAVDVALIDWRKLLEVEGDLGALSLPAGPAVLRIESPDKQIDVVQRLLAIAARHGPFDEGAAKVDYRDGRMFPLRQFHAGFCHVLDAIDAHLVARPDITPWVTPRAIRTMFDKVETRRLLCDDGIPVCDGFEPTSVADLRFELGKRRWRRAYLKPRWGWSACGIVMVEALQAQALSTVEVIDGTFRNSRRLVMRPIRELEDVLAHIIAEGATCEKAVPLCQLDTMPFDARLVVVGDRVAFHVFRRSRVPITNLHLVGHRADASRCIAKVGARAWADAVAAARGAAEALATPIAGVDVAFNTSGQLGAVLEVNAFGDFLPHLVDDEGRELPEVVLERMRQFATATDTMA